MSVGGNFSSGHTNHLIDATLSCSAAVRPLENCGKCSETSVSGPVPTAVYPSMLLLGKICATPTPEQFALYPKVAVASSVRTQALMTRTVCDPSQRFSQYRRYQVPVPCPPLPPSMAGISRPSVRACNL